MELLNDRWNTADAESRMMARFENRRRKSEEPLQEYADALEAIAVRVFSVDVAAIRNRQRLEELWAGLPCSLTRVQPK